MYARNGRFGTRARILRPDAAVTGSAGRRKPALGPPARRRPGSGAVAREDRPMGMARPRTWPPAHGSGAPEDRGAALVFDAPDPPRRGRRRQRSGLRSAAAALDSASSATAERNVVIAPVPCLTSA